MYILLRSCKFTDHHSGSPKISYVDKCVFQVGFPHQCITGIIRVPGCASSVSRYSVSIFYFNNNNDNNNNQSNSSTTFAFDRGGSRLNEGSKVKRRRALISGGKRPTAAPPLGGDKKAAFARRKRALGTSIHQCT